jgi:hypothetical protein
LKAEVTIMTSKLRTLSRWAVAAGVVFVLGSQSPAMAKGPRIPVGDDPSLKEGSPKLVLIEISDFQ